MKEEEKTSKSIDPYYISIEESKKKWNSSSILLVNQIRDIRSIEQQCNGPWKTILNDHIGFLANFNNEADDFIQQSMHLHRLQNFQIHALTEIVESYSRRDPDLFKQLVQKLKKRG